MSIMFRLGFTVLYFQSSQYDYFTFCLEFNFSHSNISFIEVLSTVDFANVPLSIETHTREIYKNPSLTAPRYTRRGSP